jgi:hypothetical protein
VITLYAFNTGVFIVGITSETVFIVGSKLADVIVIEMVFAETRGAIIGRITKIAVRIIASQLANAIIEPVFSLILAH